MQAVVTHNVVFQVVVPQSQIQPLLEAYHTQMGHQGQERTLSLVRRNFYWPKMEKSVSMYIRGCSRCVVFKVRQDGKAPLVPMQPKAPLRPTDHYQNILVVTDLFTKYAWAIPMTDQTASTTARAPWGSVFQPFGCPKTLHSDQGPNFKSQVIREL